MVTSILDNDLYNLTQQQWAFHNAPTQRAEYRFICRNPEGNALLMARRNEIADHLIAFDHMRLTAPERQYLRGLGYFQEDYLDFLSDYRFKPSQLHFDQSGGEFNLTVEGPWHEAILWETPLLATISEITLRGHGNTSLAECWLREKLSRAMDADPFDELRVIEFGTRRRYSGEWQERLLEIFGNVAPSRLVGTSNVKLAQQFGLKPVGTMAHQYLSAWTVLSPDYDDFQVNALNAWLQEYRGLLGVALTDVAGTDAFLRDLTYPLAKCLTGFRHDSWDPIAWGHKVSRRLHQLGIHSNTKDAVWSDSLTLDKANEIRVQHQKTFRKCLFGIGTSLTNDCGVRPLDAVLKLVKFDGVDVAKLSDVPGKAVGGSDAAIQRLKEYAGL